MSKIANTIKAIKKLFASNEQYISILREGGVKIGSNCVIHKNAIFGTEPYLISIGDNVRITTGVKIITHDGGLWVLRNMGLVDKRSDKVGSVTIGNNVNIGWDAIIMPGVTIGDNVVIGCGSIVTKDVPSNSVAAGVPARVIESIDEYARKNADCIIMTKGLNKEEKKRKIMEILMND